MVGIAHSLRCAVVVVWWYLETRAKQVARFLTVAVWKGNRVASVRSLRRRSRVLGPWWALAAEAADDERCAERGG